MSKAQNPPRPTKDKIFRQFDRMLASPDFNATPQQISFLKFVVNQVLDGKAREIGDYTVAAEVFGRGPGFDPSIDPVVSIQAGLLRQRLARYYQTAGKNDPIRIDIPTGTYGPTFEKRLYPPTADTAIDGQYPDIRAENSRPAVLIRPLHNLSGKPCQVDCRKDRRGARLDYEDSG